MCRWIDGDGSVDLWTDGWETIFVLPSSPKTVDVNDSAVDGKVAVAVFLSSSIGCRGRYLTPQNPSYERTEQQRLLQPCGLFQPLA